MNHLKIYENFKSHSDWKIGDIVVAVNGNSRLAPLDFYSSRGKLVKGDKYKIIDIKDTSDYGQTPERFPIRVMDKENNNVRDSFDKANRKVYLSRDNFITLEEWELKNAAQKYNL